ncbi:sulfatase-like hydrolase/transferase [Aeoliella mucimassa]|uniref:Arylsulfatase n=1 Tax=Aeoliella mucimassa TaxID=2527972 RepID=A0A518AV53_9BACT|nr:sulfatase-like hydrolase/transferase [Aeoliella mucimassa]QDU58592.1 Arylsulfatase [Aeoliella mucimassa]
MVSCAFRSTTVLLLVVFVAQARAEQPNVLFILTDDQSFDAVHALGWQTVETPNLDRLIERGTTFTHAYNMGSWSGAVCVASRTMLFTGQTVWHAQRDVPKLNAKYVDTRNSWPQRMSDAGYRTGMTGKWHVAVQADSVFHEVRHVRPGMPRDKAKMYNRPHPGEPDPFDPADKSAGGYWQGGKHWSEVVADDAIAMLDSPEGDDRPFFLYTAFNAPHDPRQSPTEFLARYPREQMDVPNSFLPEYPFAEAMGAGRGLRDERLAPFPRTEYAIRAHRAEYAAIITHLDVQIGRLLDALEAKGLDENTRIVFTSDHGLAIGRHGLLGKQNMYDHSVRMPLVIAGPGIAAGEQIDQRVYMQDVVPTTLHWAGASTAGIEFQSLMPLVAGETDSARPSIYGGYLNRQRMITSGDWKLIVYPQANAVRLYNLADDPEERHDLSGESEYRSQVEELLEKLRKLQQTLDDPLELPAELLSATQPQ